MSTQSSITVQPVGRFDLAVELPGSKSLTNRALLLAALSEGTTQLHRVLLADDTRVMLAALSQLGFAVHINEREREVYVEGASGKIPASTASLFLGNAGTAMRFLTAALCQGQGVYTLDGIPRMRQRPIAQLVEPLNQLGAKVSYGGEPGYPPLRIEAGGMSGGAITLQPTLSSQYVSALLQAGPGMFNGIDLHFDGPVTSLPYVLMTTRLMEHFGVRVTVLNDGSGMIVMPGTYRARDYTIEPDASNASYFMVAAAIIPGSRCTIEGLGRHSLQGDVGFSRVLEKMGAGVEVNDESMTIHGADALHGLDVNLNAMPDMAQSLAVAALFAQGPTVIRDIGNLRVKETDRLAALRNELSKLGAQVRIEGDDLHIEHPTPGRLRPSSIATYDDHRMAMAFAVAGLRCEGVNILDPACVNKTFPEYWQYLDRLRQASKTAASGTISR